MDTNTPYYPAWQVAAQEAYEAKRQEEEQNRIDKDAPRQAKLARILKTVLNAAGMDANPKEGRWEQDGYVFGIDDSAYRYVELWAHHTHLQNITPYYTPQSVHLGEMDKLEENPLYVWDERDAKENIGELITKLDRDIEYYESTRIQQPEPAEDILRKIIRQIVQEELANQ